MAKKRSALSAHGKPQAKSAKHIRDSKIDFSDIPELSDEQLKSMRRIGRPLLGAAPRKMIAVRLDTEVLESLKSEARRSRKPYQSLINEILAKHVKKAA
ncbi:MAG TPA: hypothetical protein DCS07_09255 [Bdellovibrionales bacterium]|nr:MAG: hypothetical protein A2X97_12420 [Bdellovibrionales bacterium GWA1_52_35]HAR42797.1 hypothetical protein [Bdellovibrionales bacterium]HCM41652.1 hypothetical protein [Bdellovibrionales bacterium]